MSYLFERSPNLSDISAISGWDTSKVQNMEYMFYIDSAISSLEPLFGWDTTSLTNVNRMFNNVSPNPRYPDWYTALTNS